MIDLDDWERKAQFVAERPAGTQLRHVLAGPEEVLAMVAELRAAREVLRLAPRPPNFNTPTTAYVAALAAYDRAVAP